MIDTKSSTDEIVSELLQYTERLNAQEFDAFFSNVVAMNARRKAPGLSAEESMLLSNINKTFPSKKMERFLFLDQKRRDETIDSIEYEELGRLVRQLERFDAKRLEWIGQLAILKKVPLNELMLKLGLFSANNG